MIIYIKLQYLTSRTSHRFDLASTADDQIMAFGEKIAFSIRLPTKDKALGD